MLGCDGAGTTSGIIAGLDWVSRTHSGPSVINMSLGGNADAAFDAAVARTVASGVVVVVAAGNADANACNSSPSRVGSAITVAASTTSDNRAYFSNFGSCVDLFAPGVDVLSAGNASDTATRVLSGTSMASPHVAGVAALWLQLHRGAAPQDVTDAIVGNATTNVISDAGAGSPNRLVYSRFATVPQPPPSNPQLSLSQGASAPSGYWYSLTLSGYTPGSSVSVTCRDSVDPQGFWTQTFIIASDGRAGDSTLCYSGDGPDHWVTMGGTESNHVTWGGTPPPPPPTSPIISLSRGGGAPSGFWYSVGMSGFSPGESVTLRCRDSVDPQGFWTQTFTIGGDGRAGDTTLCYSGDHPDHWVTGAGIESNHVSW